MTALTTPSRKRGRTRRFVAEEQAVPTIHPFLWDKRVRQACAANGGGSPPPRHRNARCQLRQVTSTSFRTRPRIASDNTDTRHHTL